MGPMAAMVREPLSKTLSPNCRSVAAGCECRGWGGRRRVNHLKTLKTSRKDSDISNGLVTLHGSERFVFVWAEIEKV